jgi:hypothetical protein
LERPQYTSISKDELRRIEGEAQRAGSVDDLRALFDRLQAIRRTYIDDFDVQLAISHVQQSIVERGRVLTERDHNYQPAFEFAPPAAGPVMAEPDGDEARPAREPRPGHDERELPPHVQKIDDHTWKRATYIGAFLAIILFAVFFYLIQTARRFNFASEEAQNQTSGQPSAGAQQKPNPGSPQNAPAAPPKPALRLYTDLVPGTVTIDGKSQPLQDGELQLDTLTAGKHALKLTGSTGSAEFEFESAEKAAPHITNTPVGTEAMIVTASVENGKGQLLTNAAGSNLLLDNKDLGPIPAGGVALSDLGQSDHNLQIKGASDTQRFILTYIPQPALTVFVKSDLNAGSLIILTGEDGAEVTVDGQKYRRKTGHGQLRIATLKAGAHTIKVAKPGFLEVPPQTVQIKKNEESRLVFRLQPQPPPVATLEVKGAQPGTQILIDGNSSAAIGAEGGASIGNVAPGDHQIELRREGSQPKTIRRTFQPGEKILLSGADVVLTNIAPVTPPPATPAPAAQQPSTEAAAAPAAGESATMPSSIRKGGGFLIYHTTSGPGHYVFSLQLRKGGGFLKAKRLRWFLAYQNTKNYVLFEIDGKRFTVRQVVDGKSDEIMKAPFDHDPENYVQIDMGVRPDAVTVRLKPEGGSWQDMGTVRAPGEDFTKGKFGILISGNDEVGVSTVHFNK